VQGLSLPGLEQLWAILSLTTIGVLLALTPTLPHDTPFVYATWLGEWLFYVLYAVGGPQAPIFARNVLGLAGFALVAAEARRRSGSWRLAGLAALLAAAMSINNLPARTQNWSWVPFAIFALILGAYAAGQARARWLAVLPALMAFWVNAHGAFVLGLVLAALVAAGETLRALLAWRGRSLSLRLDGAQAPAPLDWRRLRALYFAALATLAATLLNPLGPGIFGYVAKLLTDPPSQGLVVEWQPPTTRSLAGFFFFASILALLATFALARRRPTLTDTLMVCAFLWLAWGGQRYVVWFGMLAMPVLAQCLAAARPTQLTRRRDVPSTLIALVLLAGLVVVQPPFKPSLDMPAPYRALFADVPGAPQLYAAETPAAAAEYLRAHPIAGRLYNEMGYGSYLDWALYPAAQVFVDPRVELYPLEIWQDYLAIRDARDYNALLIDKYDVRRVLLDRFIHPRLAAALAADPRWEREYADTRAEIYRRR
jgi:hypothetical protein